MTSGPITPWQIDGVTMKTLRDFICLGSKITTDSDCSHEIKRYFPFRGKKKYDKPRYCIKKNRHYFADKGMFSQTCVFSRSQVHMRVGL